MASPNQLQPADIIDQILVDWSPGYFKEPRDLSFAAMRAVGINPPHVDISLESLAADLIENDKTIQGER